MQAQSQPTALIRNSFAVSIRASTERVWDALTLDTADWWPEDFYFSGQPGQMRLQAELGGKLYEQARDGSRLVWYSVVAVEAGASISLAGLFTPPHASPAHCTLQLQLDAIGAGRSLLQCTEGVSGVASQHPPAPVAQGWDGVFEDNLRPFVEAQPIRAWSLAGGC